MKLAAIKKQGGLFVALPIFAFLGLFLLLPLFLAVGSAFVHEGGISLYWFGRIVGNAIRIRELLTAGVLALTTTAACCLVAIPMAVLQNRTRFPGQKVLGVLILLPLILPPFVGALAMRRILAPYGTINLVLNQLGIIDLQGQLPPNWGGSGFAAVVILQTLHLFPIMYLNAAAALANIDPSYIQAARNLGARPLTAFFRITLPLMRPGLFAGGTIVFIWSFTDIGTPVMLEYDKVTAVTIFKELARGNYSGWTYCLVFVMLAVSVILYLAGKSALGQFGDAETSKASVTEEARRLGWPGTVLAWTLFAGAIFLAVLPHIGVILTACADQWGVTILPQSYTTRHLTHVFRSESTYRSIFNSLKYAGVSTGLDLLIGCTIAWLVVRTRIAGRTALDTLAVLPLAVPGLILAAGYVALTVKGGPFESIGPTRNPFTILVIAYAVRRLPFVVRGVSAGIQQVPESLEEAARNLGATGPGTAWRITLPLVLPSVIAATVLTFSFAILEVSDSLILAQVQSDYPITKQIYSLATSTGAQNATNEAAALGVYGMLLLGGAMLLAGLLLGRKLGSVFRA
jgi:iron(III) transport system permease protein